MIQHDINIQCIYQIVNLPSYLDMLKWAQDNWLEPFALVRARINNAYTMTENRRNKTKVFVAKQDNLAIIPPLLDTAVGFPLDPLEALGSTPPYGFSLSPPSGFEADFFLGVQMTHLPAPVRLPNCIPNCDVDCRRQCTVSCGQKYTNRQLESRMLTELMWVASYMLDNETDDNEEGSKEDEMTGSQENTFNQLFLRDLLEQFQDHETKLAAAHFVNL